jgi:hypothetical protein
MKKQLCKDAWILTGYREVIPENMIYVLKTC